MTEHAAPEHVNILMFDATGQGGVARTVTALANRLANTHHVEIHSLLRNSEHPQFPIDPRVRIHWLIDNRRSRFRGGRPRRNPRAPRKWRDLDSVPSALEPQDAGISAYTDLVLRKTLPELKGGVLITTRPMMHVAAARWAPDHVVLIAQDHLNFPARMRNPTVRSLLDEAVPQVDAFVTLTEADRLDYQDRYRGARIRRIPNASPFPRRDPAPLNAKVVVAAGRLVAEKGFDRLIDAWSAVTAEFPDWELHIYGKGELGPALRQRIRTAAVGQMVRLKGFTADFDRVLAGASLFAMSSRVEGFPMVLLEAMSHGLPLLSFDCPRGPAEIIRDGVNGRLVPDRDVHAYTRALRDILSDDTRRRAMGAASHEDAARYEIETVAADWEELLSDTLTHRMAAGPLTRP